MIALLLILIPLVAGLACFLMKEEKLVRLWSLIISIIVLFVSIAGNWFFKTENYVSFSADWMQTFGSSFSLKLDGMGQVLCLLNAIAYPLVLLGTRNTPYRNANNFFGLMLLAQAGMMGVFLAMDALLFYFFWELALIPMYFICSAWGGEKRIRVTFKFFIYTFLGSVVMLIGILYLYSLTPDQSFSLDAFYALNLSAKTQQWVFWLFFIAFAIKIPVFPLHTWQPDTYEQSPTAATMILSGVMVKMGLLGVIRWLIPVLPLGADAWSIFVAPLALAGLIYASLLAIQQDDLKRLVAYSSIAHLGMMCAAAFSNNIYGMQGVMFQMFSHGINVIGLWIMVDIIEKRFGTRRLSELGGLAQKAPAMAMFFVVISLANIALPLTNAFIGEFMMFNGIFQAQTQFYLWWTVMAGIGIVLSAVYMLNMIRKVFYGGAGTAAETGRDLSGIEKFVFGLIVAVILFTGIYPQPVLDITKETAEYILSSSEILPSMRGYNQ
jgi:NADH-quinone oxidoreductase subunit M